MAGADYYRCDKCDSKAFYDAHIDYADEKVDYGCGYKLGYVGDMKVICDKCAETNVVIIVEKT